MAFGKDSSFIFIIKNGKLVNIGRSDDTATAQPFDPIEEEVWRIFNEHRELQAANKVLKANQFPKEPICEEYGKPRRCLGILWARHAKPCKQKGERKSVSTK